MNEGCVLMFVVVHLCLAAEKREREREREKRQGDCATKSRKNMVKRDGGSTVTTQQQHNTENIETGF